METRERFLRLWNNLGADNAERNFYFLKKHYDEKHRYYHNLDHVMRTLGEFDNIKHLANNHLAVELAIWYHDVIYDPHSSSNEHDSALYLLEQGHEVNIPSGRILMNAHNLVMATRHIGNPQSIDEAIIRDCDIASFGTSEKMFDQFNTAIWKEYSFVEPMLFQKKRREILKSYIDKPRIYYTEPMHELYEENARRNIANLLNTHFDSIFIRADYLNGEK